MAGTFQPPAQLRDFDRSANSQQLHDEWHKTMEGIVKFKLADKPAFYNPLDPPSDETPETAAPEWTGLPRTIKRLVPTSIAAAARLVDNPIRMGGPDPMQGPNFSPPFVDNNGNQFVGPAYRPQDEYLEWVTRRAPDGTITEIIFTCEGPEYWDLIAQDEQLLVDLYRELVGNNSIQLSDLVFPRDVSWQNPNGGPQTFEAGQYNPYNKWNIFGAVHLTQPANTLAAEVQLAKDASLLYGNPIPVTTDPDLVCCGAYGGINRMSDPTIGSGVNTQVQVGNRVTLRNPIGLYIKKNGIRLDAFSLPDNKPFQHVQECFEILRPAPAEVTDMIVRARFRVPAGIKFNGSQLRVGDLKVNGEKIVTGGQVADVITMTLFAQAISGAPAQPRRPCRGRPCPDKERPSFIHLIPFSSTCANDGISFLGLNLELASAALNADTSNAAEAAFADVTEEPLPKTRYALSRIPGGGL